MSLVHLMFLNYSPKLRHPLPVFGKFSLPYSLALTGLIRQISPDIDRFGTMGMLRLPSPFSFPSVSLGLDTIYGIAFSFALIRWLYIPNKPGQYFARPDSPAAYRMEV